jgi:hypothetical protein
MLLISCAPIPTPTTREIKKKIRQFDLVFAHAQSSRPFRLARKSVLHWSIGVVKRCEIDAVPCSNCLYLVDPLRSDEASSLREGLEPALQSESHAF